VDRVRRVGRERREREQERERREGLRGKVDAERAGTSTSSKYGLR
jgi:hypothetical protein